MAADLPENYEVNLPAFRFIRDVPTFEAMLIESGLKIVKLWLDVSKAEQARRLEERRTDPLKALKASPLDAVAQKKWDAYSEARDRMLTRSSTALSPWICVRADHKHKARLAILGYLAHTLAPASIASAVPTPDPAVLFPFESAALTDGRLER